MVVGISPITKDVMTCITQSLEVLYTVWQAYGFNQNFNLKATSLHWAKLTQAAGGDWMSVAKYKLAAFFSFHMQQVTPECPFPKEMDKPSVLLGGKAFRWQRRYLMRSQLKVSFLTSILQSKKGMPRPGPEDLEKAVEKTVAKLTGEPIAAKRGKSLINWGDADLVHPKIEQLLAPVTIKEQLRRTVKELFSDVKFSVADRIKAFFPSTSANYINSRSNAGAVGFLLQHPDLLKGLRRPGGYLTVTRDPRQQEEHIEAEEEDRIILDTTALEHNFEELWHRMLYEANLEEPHVEPVALAEALKKRVISKGPPILYTVLRPLWKKVHTILRQHPIFCLIGTPITEEILLNVLGSDLKEGEAFLSGDYEAATDNLYSWVSEEIADAISEELQLLGIEKRLFIRALTGHLIRGLPQRNGQLMGSIVSFPVLCIANAAASRWAAELAENKPLQLKQCKMLINGDDVAIRGKASVYQFWRTITSAFGLKESIGKTFLSTKFVNINSTNFTYEETPHPLVCTSKDGNAIVRQCRYTLVPYVNMGLISGLKRSQGVIGLDDQDDPRNNIGVRASELLRLCPPALRGNIYNLFLRKHKQLLAKTHVPWFLPRWLGGLGLPITEEHKPSELDLSLARLAVFNWKKKHPTQLGISESPWYLRQAAEKALPQPESTFEKSALTEDYEKLVGLQTVNLLFDSHSGLADLYKKTQGRSRAGKIIKYNSQFYDPKRFKHLPKPFTIEQIQYQALYSYIRVQFKSSHNPFGIGTDSFESTPNVVRVRHSNVFSPLSLAHTIGGLD